MANSLRPTPLSFDSGRQSPFKRQNSASPATVRATTPTQSPTKPNGSLSPTKVGSLSPEKASPFVRRPSQISQTSERPTSPFARPSSSLSIPASPSRQSSRTSNTEEVAPPSPRTTASPEEEEPIRTPSGATPRAAPSPSPFDGPAPDSPSRNVPSQANLRPTFQRTVTSSTTSTVKPLNFGNTNAAPAPKPARLPTKSNSTAYKNVPHTLLHSMRESFEVLDPNSTNTITSAEVSSMLDQMGMSSRPADLCDFFPPNAPSNLNLARYLDMLSAPLAELSPPDELKAAFEAFDVDDSGQIDVTELRRALLNTAPEPGEEVIDLSEREVDSVIGEFVGRRAFGAKGMNAAKGKGEVFRWREFMGAVTGGGAGEADGREGVTAA
ncbi:uncharacterized protein LTR77_003510 [Saxophila tyrrhenica]|uniref:EF-hand domain-containing protein n=1 Tax=Saxophila tyrrhenica TaxID=1690608 RepID=A0AAV9PDZ3_9PEZI|nr:hypothetical protein LTR77_003510 [Saxophila tyrrhenica]